MRTLHRLGAWLTLLAATGCQTDVDGDGYAAKVDCNDEVATIHPDAQEACNSVDDNCDGNVDEGLDAVVSYADVDGDAFGDPATATTRCDVPDGNVLDNTDCDDTNAAVNPDATEVCNDVDDDCEGGVDEDLAVTWYRDADADGYGYVAVSIDDCAQPEGYVDDATDCDDAVDTTFPGADERCNTVDDDCDEAVDEDPVDGLDFPADADADGFGDPAVAVYGCVGVDNALDCDDADPAEPKAVDLGTGTPTGTGTRADPMDAIQAAIDAANGCVVVWPGSYDERIDFHGKDLVVTGLAGAAETILVAPGGEAKSAVVTFDEAESSAAVLRGFTLTGGTGRLEQTTSSYSCGSGATCTNHYDTYCGGGVAIDGAWPTLIDLVIFGNTLPVASTTTSGSDTFYVYSFGGGVCLQSAAGVSLDGVDMSGNFADQGGGLYADAATIATIEHASFLANHATDGGGVAVDGAQVSLTNVLFADNGASDTGGGLAAVNTTLGLWNGTFGYGTAASGGGLYLGGSSHVTLDSTIVYASAGNGVVVGSGVVLTTTYNDVSGNTAANWSGFADPTGSGGNLAVDPLFVTVIADGDPNNDDWHLGAASPAINTGNPARQDPDGTRTDIGAYGGPGGAWR